MKKALLIGLVGVSGIMATATAYAAEAIWGRVVDLTLLDGANNSAYQVQTSGSIFQNPRNCSTGYYEAKAGLTAAQYDAMNKTLLSAFLAGRKVKMQISETTCGPNNRPAYYGVRLHETQ